MVVPFVLLLAVLSAICWILWKACKFLASLDTPATCEQIKQRLPEKSGAETSTSTSILQSQSFWAIGIVMIATFVGIGLGYRQKDWLGLDTAIVIFLVAVGLSVLFSKKKPEHPLPTEQKVKE